MANETKPKGRGGAGRGQGRKFKLEYMDRAWIYGRYWQLYNQSIEDNLREKSEKFETMHGLDEQRKELHNIPINLKRKSDNKSARQVMTGLANSNDEIPEANEEDLPELITEAAHTLRDIRETLDKNGRLISCSKPKRKIEDLLEQVANEATERFKGRFRQKITARYVRDIKTDKRKDFSFSD